MDEAKNIVSLNGEFRFKADSKGRVSLPAIFRKELPSDLVITQDPAAEYLMVFTKDAYNDWVNSILKANFGEFDSSSRVQLSARRQLHARGTNVQIDTAGRVVIPIDKREAAAIDKDVVIVGNEGFFEIWDAKRYEAAGAEFDLSQLLASV